ncbi:heat shock protein of HSP70 family [Scheffersomyces coipomensis]|uniref:heat shock protein of HSP70 family n=1 Tax=Scheffersomyces coipomensis TaxID=1788519 RepID=UPI00315CB903
MSTPFGIDLGTSKSVISAARNGGIDVIVNEVSNRATPSLVGFGPKNRLIGESAKNKQISNVKNTVDNIKRIVGLDFDDADLEIEKKYFTVPLVKDAATGGVSAKVRLGGEQKEFTATQLSAMLINKLKDTAHKETKANLEQVALSVPLWYNEKQRHAAADACRIAGLTPVQIVNEVTAAAVGYGVFKANELPVDEPKKIAFIDIGHSSYQISIASVKKGELKILGSAYDKHFGGRDFDYAIAEHFAKEFKDKKKLDVHENPKAFYRVLVASEKVKKVLSANSQAPFSVESLMEDVDFSSSLTREELEAYVQPLLNRVNVPIEAALKDAGLTIEDIDSVEVIGGCTRVPSLKQKLTDIFGKPLSFTLNQDEAIARGNAYICAVHSPTVRVRPFKFSDYNQDAVTFSWDKQLEDDENEIDFPRDHKVPKEFTIKFQAKQDFEASLRYTGSPIDSKPIAKWQVKGVVPKEGESEIEVKLYVGANASGWYTLDAAETREDTLVKVLVEHEDEEDAEPEYKEEKKNVKKDDLQIIVLSSSQLTESVRNEFIEVENALTSTDKLVADTEERKNTLEEYIYELRGKLEDQYKDFASEQEKETLTALLLKTEDWLYDEGEDAKKAKYIAKYEELASKGNIIRGRYLAKEQEKKEANRQKQEAANTAALQERLAASRGQKPTEEKAAEPEDIEMD